MSGDDIEIDSGILDVLMAGLPEDMWANEATRNIIEYGATIGVFGPVWDAVVNYGTYPLGIWSDSLFTPEKMADYMPRIGVKDGHVAQEDGNFHAGSRLSLLKWTDFAVLSRPDPKKPDDVFVTYLFKDPASGSYRVWRWAHSSKSGLAKAAHVDDLTSDEIDMLGFDPKMAIYDEGFLYRLSRDHSGKRGRKGKLVGDGPVTCFVLTGRDGNFNTWQGETGKGRPLTRSVINDRFWSPQVPIWCWEFNKPDQPDTWLAAPPDGKTVSWKEDATHQYRRQWGLSQVVSGADPTIRREPPELTLDVLLDDGTKVEFYVFPFLDSGRSPLDNATFDVVRNGGYVIDYKNESYHTRKKPASLKDWGVWNEKVAVRTLIRVIPPVWDAADPAEPGVKTDIARANLYWQQGPSKSSIERKLGDWQQEINALYTTTLQPLRELMSGAAPQEDSEDVTHDLQDLATTLGDLYTRKVLIKVEVPDPDATKQGPGIGRRPCPRRPWVSTICPECGAKLPLPGHADNCSLKPVKSEPAPPIPKGEKDWDGDISEDPGGTDCGPVTIPDPDAIKEVEILKTVPVVAFPHIEKADWSALSNRGFNAISWLPQEGPTGTLRVAWGLDPTNPDRYPPLVQAFDRLCDTYGVPASDVGRRTVIERALWRAVRKVLSGKFGHLAGQASAGTFPRDDSLAHIATTNDHQVIVMGLTVALFGVQDLERFAKPILKNDLGKELSGP